MTQENICDERVQDFPLSTCPMDERKKFWDVAMVLLGFTFFTGTMWAGALLGPAFGFSELMLVIFVGNLLLGVYVAFLGYVAFHTGLSTTLLARYSFGDHGSRWVDFIFLFTQIGWQAWGIAMISIFIGEITGLTSQLHFIILCIIFGFAFASTAWIGFKGLAILSNVAVPLMLILIVISMTIATRDAGGLSAIFAWSGNGSMTWAAAITVVFGTYVSGGTQSTNWSRFSKTAKFAVIASLLAFFVGNGLMVIGGSYGAMVYGEHDMVRVLGMQGLLVLGVILLLANLWTSQDNTAYNFSMAGSTMFRNPNRKLFVLVGTVISIILAIFGMYNFLFNWLVLMGTFIPPVGGILIADFFIKHRSKVPALENVKFKQYNLTGLITYVLASLVAYFSPGVAPINGILAAVIIYPILDAIFRSMNMPQDNTVKEQV
jgi:cytosine permease